MSSHIFHNTVRLVDAQALTVSGGATPSYTSEWWNTEGWVEKKVEVDADPASSTPDINIFVHVSPYDAYYLNSITATTEYYEAHTVKDAHVATILTGYDSDDCAILGKPCRAMRVSIANDSATIAITSVTAWLSGQS